MNRRLFCFGHRGARGHEPENTLRSVRKALELGADGIEIDVYFVDGQLIVIHDDTLNRTTNGKGRLDAKTFRELRSLDAGKGERIPTLSEVFDAVNRRAVINIELKGPGTAEPVARLIQERVKNRGWRFGDFLISSFDWDQLEQIRKCCPRIRIGLLTDKIPRDLFPVAKQLEAWSIHPAAKRVTRALVRQAHRRKLKVYVYTVNHSKIMDALKDMGVDGLFTDFPERCLHGK
ncbi:MAG TPA: glycerophosphodiester phosphodiesterase family protein [Desulfuromonadaceae bacterium]|nr:glycerophosphodiester phosphodiesterase family protein [Desulfuromonadaceae bacterium]